MTKQKNGTFPFKLWMAQVAKERPDKMKAALYEKRGLKSTPDENRTHIVGTGIRYSIH